MTGHPRCPFTGKRRHPDRAAAHHAARRATAARQVYRCGFCSAFHISAMSRAQYLMWPGRHANNLQEK